ncbi:phage terminase small subunit [Streptomyces sp. 6N223]|uniref:phage terminase small subunit n=1 Tax=Streptomyces sp. 6N223 TaxID=3457412 RepID=UPI003FD099E6
MSAAGRNKPDGPELVKARAGSSSEVPPADESWHPIAARRYTSLAESGQSQTMPVANDRAVS